MKSKISGEDEMNKRLKNIKSLMGDPSLTLSPNILKNFKDILEAIECVTI